MSQNAQADGALESSSLPTQTCHALSDSIFRQRRDIKPVTDALQRSLVSDTKRTQMPNSSVVDLQRLIKEYRINLHPPQTPDSWPLPHKVHFESIRKVAQLRFDTYSASIDIRSNEQPWKEGSKRRAEFLATRAARLSKQGRNEEGWRLSLENEVLRRFSVEVACRTCRARIWRSEVEAAISEHDDSATSLRERRNQRKPCECPPKDRPEDYYEVGTNPLFDDRAEQLIIHDPLNQSQLPEKKPDRVYGLVPTRNFEQELSRVEPGLLGPRDGTTVAERVRSTPFKGGAEQLLFPFLILEAKSDSGQGGFRDNQLQTAFPIFALLKLQEDLKSQANASDLGVIPLVWFFANRGEEWRLYGCFVSTDALPEYHIMQLWDGCIFDKDKSLQLVLIVDYIFDWARDIYRPAILKLLKSIASGQGYDQISFVDDSDIASIRRYVSDWIQPPPSTPDSDFDLTSGTSAVAVNEQNLLPMPIPNTTLGTIRSARVIHPRLTGVCVGQSNVQNLLQQAGGHWRDASASERVARELVSFLTKWDELIVLKGEAINTMESTWIGKPQDEASLSALSAEESFYFVAEVQMFVDEYWHIVRQLAYLAISKSAFDTLVRYAAYQVNHPGIQAISDLARPCSSSTFSQSIQCLQCGSVDQVFKNAISCTSLSLYSMPERRRSDYVPRTETLGFGVTRRPRLVWFVEKIHKMATRKSRSKHIDLVPISSGSTDHRKQSSAKKRKIRYRAKPSSAPTDRSYVRLATGRLLISEDDGHAPGACERCRQFRACGGKHLHVDVDPSEDVFSEYGICLVLAPDYLENAQTKYSVCLFAADVHSGVSDNQALAVVTADLAQCGSAYYTFRKSGRGDFKRPDPRYSRDQLWNLPCSFRPFPSQARKEIWAWVKELSADQVSLASRSPWHLDASMDGEDGGEEENWDYEQLLLHYLKQGQPYQQAKQSVATNHRSPSTPNTGVTPWIDRGDLYRKLDEEEEESRKNYPDHRGFRIGPTWLPRRRFTRGDVDEPVWRDVYE